MGSKERLCTHCGRFIEYDDAVRVCIEGGFAHAGCEHSNYGDWHESPTALDVADLRRMLLDEEADTDDHR